MYSNLGSGGYTAEQTYIHNGNNNNAGNTTANANNNQRPSERNRDLADNGDARASKVVGTAVYSEKDQKLGNVNDILIGKNGVFAVISTNHKKVSVPFNELKFGNATNMGDDRIVLPNETQARLNTEPVVHYNETNYQAARNNNTVRRGALAANNVPNATGNGAFGAGHGNRNGGNNG